MSQPTTDIRRGWTSASNALSDSLCPGRHLAQKGIPEPAKGDDATSGTRIHQALADETMIAKLSLQEREVFDACRSIEKKIASQYFADVKGNMRVFRHQRFWTRFNTATGLTLEHSGEADVVYRCVTKLLVADYKTLVGDVEDSPKNLQLRDLAVLSSNSLMPIEEVATVIIQPFVTHSPEVCVYSKEDLKRAMEQMFTRVALSNDPASPRVAGEHQCNFCLARLNCVVYQKWASAILPTKLLQVMEIPIISWSPEQRAVAAAALGPAQDLLDDIKRLIKEGLEKSGPDFCPGFYLKPGNKRETINNPQECFNRFAALGGTLEQFMKTITVGKTKLRDETNVVTKAKGQALDKVMSTMTEGIVDVKQDAPSLKKLGD